MLFVFCLVSSSVCVFVCVRVVCVSNRIESKHILKKERNKQTNTDKHRQSTPISMVDTNEHHTLTHTHTSDLELSVQYRNTFITDVQYRC